MFLIKQFFRLFFIFLCLVASSAFAEEARRYSNAKLQYVSIEGKPGCGVYYPFNPVPPKITARYSGSSCDGGFPWSYDHEVDVEFYSNGVLDSRIAKAHVQYVSYEGEIWGEVDGATEWTFYDGEKWQGNSHSWWKVAETPSRAAKINKEKQAKEKIEKARIAQVQKSLTLGDEINQGIVLQVRGGLVKVQSNESQCTQRDYKGGCMNYVSTPVEKWIKRSDVLPK